MNRPVAAAFFVTLAASTASVWWLHRQEAQAPNPEPISQAPHKNKGPFISTIAKPSVAAARPAVVEDSSWDPELIKRVEHKYRYLLGEARLSPAQAAQLRELLLQREQLHEMAGVPDDPDSQLDPAERSRIERALAGLDARIRAMLDAAQFSHYETLRESDIEQNT